MHLAIYKSINGIRLDEPKCPLVIFHTQNEHNKNNRKNKRDFYYHHFHSAPILILFQFFSSALFALQLLYQQQQQQPKSRDTVKTKNFTQVQFIYDKNKTSSKFVG